MGEPVSITSWSMRLALLKSPLIKSKPKPLLRPFASQNAMAKEIKLHQQASNAVRKTRVSVQDELAYVVALNKQLRTRFSQKNAQIKALSQHLVSVQADYKKLNTVTKSAPIIKTVKSNFPMQLPASNNRTIYMLLLIAVILGVITVLLVRLIRVNKLKSSSYYNDFDQDFRSLSPQPVAPPAPTQNNSEDLMSAESPVTKKPSDKVRALAGDDIGATKLDLATAYIDMGDFKSAKRILQEVIETGSPIQSQEAERLMQRAS